MAPLLLAPAVTPENQSQKDSLSNLPKSQKYAIYETGYGITTDALKRGLEIYHRVSCRPITTVAEEDMEILSDIYGEEWGEKYLHHWQVGSYLCSRCKSRLFSSEDKWNGPCRWPSFRKPATDNDAHPTHTRANAGTFVATAASSGCCIMAASLQSTSTPVTEAEAEMSTETAEKAVVALSNTGVDLVEVYPYNNYTVTVKEVYCKCCDLFIGMMCRVVSCLVVSCHVLSCSVLSSTSQEQISYTFYFRASICR